MVLHRLLEGKLGKGGRVMRLKIAYNQNEVRSG